MPLRGKILNTWDLESSEIIKSQEIKNLSTAIGVMPGNPDISSLRYGKICILADADSDGLHIATLLCALFLRHFKALVNEGRIYIAMPPLYRIDCGKEVLYALDELQKENFFWGPDPSSQDYSTIGGNIANNSAGPRAIKYGTPRDNILGLEFISGTGEIHKTGVKTSKGVVGLDLTRLFVGSEGILGILSEATLKILPLNNGVKTFEITFETLKSESSPEYLNIFL